MNTLSRVDSYLFSLVSSPPPPAPAALSNVQPESAPTFTFPTSNEPASKSSSVNTSPSPSPAPANSTSTVRRRFPTTRRRRRRHPTSSSIKVPPPTTPLLLRVALAIWSILLSFWRSLVGDTRAVRVLRHKRNRTVTVAAVPVGAGAAPDRLAESPAAAAKNTTLGLGHPAVSPASSDDSASEHEGWVDPVTRAPVDNGTPMDSDSEVDFGRPRVPETMSIQLQSSLRKSGLDSKLDGGKQPKFVTTVTAPTPRRTPRLLPNPMQTSLLDPSVPAVPHRSVSPTNAPSVRPQHTPFHLQKTLILDLDETLIHSTSRPMGASHSGTGMLGLGPGLFGGKRRRREGHTIEVVLNGRSTTYHVYKRPYVDFFLKRVSFLFASTS